MLDTVTRKSFLIKLNCLVSTGLAGAAVFTTPWLFIPAFMNLAAATILLRKK